MSFWDTVGNIINGGLQVYDAYQKEDAKNSYINAMKEREDYNYQNSQNAYDAYLEYQNQVQAGNGAYLGAFNASEAQRMGALNNAYGAIQQGLQQANQVLLPYVESGERMLPIHEKAGKKGIKGLQMLGKTFFSPEIMQAYSKPVSFLDATFLGEIPETLKQKNVSK